MHTKKSFINMVVAVLFLLGGAFAMADSPKDIKTPDSHSAEVKGKVSMFRVQIKDMGLGAGANQVKGEVFITLDSNANQVYSLQVDEASSASNKMIADTLRDAYINKVPVTLYYQKFSKTDNYQKILMVQLD